MRIAAVCLALLATACGKGNSEPEATGSRERGDAPLAQPAASAITPVDLANASFDDGPDLGPWQTDVGATNQPATGGDPTRRSRASIVAGAGRNGTAALELSGDAATGTWLAVGQSIAVEPDRQVQVSFWMRTDDLTPEGRQFHNANVLVSFYDAAGQRLLLETSPPVAGTTDWFEDRFVSSPAPAGATRARFAFFSSVSGTMWIDDVSVSTRAVQPWSRSVAAGAWQHLVDRVDRTYPFRPIDTQRARWRETTGALATRAAAAADRAAFIEVVREALAVLADPHVTIRVGGQTVPTVAPRQVPTSWSFDAIKAAVKEPVLAEDGFGVVRLNSGLGYVLIGTWDKGRAAMIERVLAAMDQLSDVRGWIIDVRINQGGDEHLASLVAGRFAPSPVIYARQRLRVGDGYGPWSTRELTPAAAADTRPVVVLQGPLCMSSTEGFIAMMRELPNVTTLGLPSRGATRNPGPIHVSSDITVLSSRWEASLPDGALIEGVGIPPDVVVDAPESAYGAADPTFEAAVARLR